MVPKKTENRLHFSTRLDNGTHEGCWIWTSENAAQGRGHVRLDVVPFGVGEIGW
jgi:hypothetical protein